jgi:hypothetical protein
MSAATLSTSGCFTITAEDEAVLEEAREDDRVVREGLGSSTFYFYIYFLEKKNREKKTERKEMNSFFAHLDQPASCHPIPHPQKWI